MGNDIRGLVIKRMLQFKSVDGFSKHLMRWAECYINKVHVSEVDFTLLSDDNLVNTFEMIIKKYYRQM